MAGSRQVERAPRGINYLRPKWGIYRSLNSSGLKTTYMLTRAFKAYQLQ
ncbi:hypothetical protein [Streptomyces sp. NPDC095613]